MASCIKLVPFYMINWAFYEGPINKHFVFQFRLIQGNTWNIFSIGLSRLEVLWNARKFFTSMIVLKTGRKLSLTVLDVVRGCTVIAQFRQGVYSASQSCMMAYLIPRDNSTPGIGGTFISVLWISAL